jgi:hypothetical protein
MKARHTPEPWLLDPDSPGHVTAQNGDAIADCFLVYSGLDRRTCLANARLIAHAPELYELLVRGLGSGVFEGAPTFRGEVIKLLKNVEGRQ